MKAKQSIARHARRIVDNNSEMKTLVWWVLAQQLL
jgi:hypothetical protein